MPPERVPPGDKRERIAPGQRRFWIGDAAVMVIYGVATLALSLLAGLFIGNVLGQAIGVDANIGGVGIAMLILLVLASRTSGRFHLAPITAQGITFWSAMYIPIVVAMAAKQNIVMALAGGPVALLAGALAVAGGFTLVPVLAKFHRARPRPAVEDGP